MADRPPIPSELRRLILTEARHHCAVCGYPSVDIHHIVPWEKCQEHEEENLVALCQNCHRRADKGAIDPASLRAYKAGLAHRRLYDAANETAIGRVESDESRWTVHRIQEQAAHPRAFTLNLEFPQFLPDAGEIAALNGIERATALEQLHEMRSLGLADPPLAEKAWLATEASLFQTFEVTLFTAEHLSFRYEVYLHNPGAMHGNTATVVRNFRRNPLIRLGLEEIFREEGQIAALLSAECIRSLEAESGTSEPDEWIRRGASPDLMNFSRFNITPWGLVITFDQYEVSSYAEGIRRVFLGKELLRPFVRKASGIAAVWE